jgi:uncharacterized protein (UPF0332 family)
LNVLHYNDEAGRAAYLAGLHAAQVLIFEHTGKTIRRHRGVQNELRKLIRDDPRFDAELRAFLGRTYSLKAVADYEIGPDAEISLGHAQQAIATASRFVDIIADLLG